jgi:hypothetical protein
MGDFGKRLFERSEFPIATHEAEQRRKQAVGGSLLFGYFFLAKQEKVTRQSRESDHLHRRNAFQLFNYELTNQVLSL